MMTVVEKVSTFFPVISDESLDMLCDLFCEQVIFSELRYQALAAQKTAAGAVDTFVIFTYALLYPAGHSCRIIKQDRVVRTVFRNCPQQRFGNTSQQMCTVPCGPFQCVYAPPGTDSET